MYIWDFAMRYSNWWIKPFKALGYIWGKVMVLVKFSRNKQSPKCFCFLVSNRQRWVRYNLDSGRKRSSFPQKACVTVCRFGVWKTWQGDADLSWILGNVGSGYLHLCCSGFYHLINVFSLTSTIFMNMWHTNSFVHPFNCLSFVKILLQISAVENSNEVKIMQIYMDLVFYNKVKKMITKCLLDSAQFCSEVVSLYWKVIQVKVMIKSTSNSLPTTAFEQGTEPDRCSADCSSNILLVCVYGIEMIWSRTLRRQ